MRFLDLINQLHASDAFADDDNPEVVLTDEDGETFEIFEVSYNSLEDRIDILTYDRHVEPVTKDLPHGIENE